MNPPRFCTVFQLQAAALSYTASTFQRSDGTLEKSCSHAVSLLHICCADKFPGASTDRPTIATSSPAATLENAFESTGRIASGFGDSASFRNSSSTTCAFRPPIPNELTAARRASPFCLGHARFLLGTTNGVVGQSTAGFNSPIPGTGGIVPCFIHSTAFTRPAKPAVSRVCPMLAFTLPIGIVTSSAI